MLNYINEHPIPLFTLGLIAQVILGVILWQTGRGSVMISMIVLACVSILLLIAAFIIKSPAEEVAETLDQIADALETNQPDKVLAFIAPDATVLRADAAQQLKRVQITEAFVSGDLKVTFDPPPEPDKPIATASFIARIKAKFLKDASPYEQLAQRFKVYFREHDDKWLVTGYEMNRR